MDEFSLEKKNQINFTRLMMIIDFTFQHLGSSHSTVLRLALQVNILAACNTATGCSGCLN